MVPISTLLRIFWSVFHQWHSHRPRVARPRARHSTKITIADDVIISNLILTNLLKFVVLSASLVRAPRVAKLSSPLARVRGGARRATIMKQQTALPKKQDEGVGVYVVAAALVSPRPAGRTVAA